MDALVSVIIPCYKSAATVGDTLDSVLAQTYANLEIIIVNDGSPDNLDEVLTPYLSQHNDIKYIKQENKGLAGARNSGAKESTGKYFLFLDSDDKIAATYIQRCVAELEKSSDVKIVYSYVRTFGAKVGKWKFPEYTRRGLLSTNIIHASAMMRSSDFFEAGTYDEEFKIYEDWNLWLGIMKNGGTVVLIPEFLFYYRKHADKSSLTDQIHKNNELAKIYFARIYENHKEQYAAEFGTVPEMIQQIFRHEETIARYKRKAAKWYRRWLRF